MFPWSHTAADTGQLDQGEEMDALQTDVMRFMALLGFILMAIFALVQALPTAPDSRRPSLERVESLRHDIDRLQSHIAQQLQTLSELRKQIQTALAMREQLAQEAHAVVNKLETAVESSRHLQTQIVRYRRQLSDLRQRLQGENQSLTALRKQVELKRHELQRTQISIAELQKRAETARQLRDRALDEARTVTQTEQVQPQPETAQAQPPPEAAEPANDLQNRLRALRAEAQSAEAQPDVKKQPREKPSSASATADAPAESTSTAVPGRAFTLRFDSREAFNHLLERGQVQFYAIVDRRVWQVQRIAGEPRFGKAKRAPQHYEMAQSTVPPEYISRFQRVVSVQGANAVTWGVVLPATIKQSIQQNIQGKDSGDIVIQRDGSVELHNTR